LGGCRVSGDEASEQTRHGSAKTPLVDHCVPLSCADARASKGLSNEMRREIHADLTVAGWIVQDRTDEKTSAHKVSYEGLFH
jgi:hypothetical protein